MRPHMVQAFDHMFQTAAHQHDSNIKGAEETIDRLDAIVKSARECLNNEKFQDYKVKYEKEEREMMSVMISYTNAFVLSENPNPSIYAMRMAMFVQKVYDLRRLLKSVEADANRKES